VWVSTRLSLGSRTRPRFGGAVARLDPNTEIHRDAAHREPQREAENSTTLH